MIENVGKRLIRDYLNDFDIFKFSSSIGNYGDIRFYTSEGNVQTPDNYEVNISSKTAKHQNLKTPEITEFQTRNLETITIPIKLVSNLADIGSSIRKLRRICENGEYYSLNLGRKKIGNNDFMLTSFKYSITRTNGRGIPVVAEVYLSLEEYIEDIIRGATVEKIKGYTNTNKEKVDFNENEKTKKELEGGRLW